MRYISTRDDSLSATFEDALLAGLAPDGGLFVPAEWPSLPDLSGAEDYAETAARILAQFAGDAFSPETLRAMTERAYGPV